MISIYHGDHIKPFGKPGYMVAQSTFFLHFLLGLCMTCKLLEELVWFLTDFSSKYEDLQHKMKNEDSPPLQIGVFMKKADRKSIIKYDEKVLNILIWWIFAAISLIASI